jgi:hypothetical protein
VIFIVKPGKKGPLRHWLHAYAGQISAFLGMLARYRITQKPIFIFSTRRSGSTLLMKLLYSQPGVDYIDLPLDLLNFHPHRLKLPETPKKNRFITLQSNEEKMLFEYFNDLLSGRLRLRHQWNPADPDFSFSVNRLLVRELMAKPLIDWFSKHFDIEIIYLIRHPIPAALSVMKLRWQNVADAYLENTYFCNNFLDSKKKAFCQDVLVNGSTLQRYVLEWCLDNLYPLKSYQQRNWFTLTYEELLLRPEQICRLICSKFNLPDPKRMYSRLSRPTISAPQSSVRDIHSRGPNYLVQRWLGQVPSEKRDEITKIFDVLDINAYNALNPYPNSELCHFGSLNKNNYNTISF